jgi:hypothetical protein
MYMHVFVFVYVDNITADLKDKSLTHTKSTKQLCKLREGFDRWGIHISWRNKKNNKYNSTGFVGLGWVGSVFINIYSSGLVSVHSSSYEMCAVCNLGERILFSISSCKRTDSNIYGSKPNYLYDLSRSQCC